MKMTKSGTRSYDLGCYVLPPKAQDLPESKSYVDKQERMAALEKLNANNWEQEAALARLRRNKSQQRLPRNASGSICCDWYNCNQEFENYRLFYAHRIRNHGGQCDCGYSLVEDESLFSHRKSVDHSYKCTSAGCTRAFATSSNVPLSGSACPIYSLHFMCFFWEVFWLFLNPSFCSHLDA